MPFFEAAVDPPPIGSLIPKCGACGLKNGCESPVMPPTGEGRSGVLIVAEAPGEEEDQRNKQLVGPAGLYFREILDEIGVDLDRDCWKTNAIVCRPPENKKPTKNQIDYCRPNLTKTLKEHKPTTVILLGDAAIRSYMAPLCKSTINTAVNQWVGWQIPHTKSNTWICPTYHPSHLLRGKSDNDKEYEVTRLWFKRHLKAAFRLASTGRPYDDVFDYEDAITSTCEPEYAASRLKHYIREGGCVSFDYETNRLKPDADDAEIHSCAVCWNGKETVAFPWTQETASVMKEFVQSDLSKIGANCKFEDRWSRRILGVPVNNWVWDCMLSAHHLDCRSGITSVEFQALVRLGVESWSDHISPFLKDADEDGINQIKKIPTNALLKYNGLDALYEYLIAVNQQKEMVHGREF